MANINGDQRYRVYNQCKYDIGVRLLNGMTLRIKPNSFQMLTVNDILFIESVCAKNKFFAQKMLVPVDDNGMAVDIKDIGMFVEEDVVPHMSDEDIVAMLKQSIKKIEACMEEINDPAELDAIYKIAKTIDLPTSKLKILKTKMPEKNWLDE